jgi:hypothetical protein
MVRDAAPALLLRTSPRQAGHNKRHRTMQSSITSLSPPPPPFRTHTRTRDQTPTHLEQMRSQALNVETGAAAARDPGPAGRLPAQPAPRRRPLPSFFRGHTSAVHLGHATHPDSHTAPRRPAGALALRSTGICIAVAWHASCRAHPADTKPLCCSCCCRPVIQTIAIIVV